jgi:uncharacterized membrane protein
MELLLKESLGAIYRAVMMVAHIVCHQQPARSPHLWDIQFPLCWRCSGILAGAVTLLIWLVLAKRTLPPYRLSVLLSLLLPFDVLIARLGIWDGRNSSRFLTGLLWGLFGTTMILHLAVRIRQIIERPDRKLPVTPYQH